MSTPYIGFGNDTLGQQSRLKDGDKITCPNCKGTHQVESGTEDGVKTDLLLFYKCGETTYLAGMAGRCVAGIKPDVSGKI